MIEAYAVMSKDNEALRYLTEIRGVRFVFLRMIPNLLPLCWVKVIAEDREQLARLGLKIIKEVQEAPTRLREIREASGLSQEELAQIVGLSDTAIHLYETGKRVPMFRTAKKIARVLGVSVSELWKEYDESEEG